ncbi:MAG: hypothetical protein IJD67_02800 [Clostridia bacterium]|nr:hypothetical protein [Clostridia bacterium]
MTMDGIFTTFAFSALFGLIRLVAIVAIIIILIVKMIRSLRKNSSVRKKKAITISVICIIIAAASFVFNMGWFRCIMLWMLIPVIHPILLFATNLYAAQYTDESSTLKLTNRLFIITYIAFWALFPDFGDIGPTYFLFGLVRNRALSYIAFALSGIAGSAHIILFIVQLVQFFMIKKRAKNSIPESDSNPGEG